MNSHYLKVIWIGDFYLGAWSIPNGIEISDEYGEFILREYNEREDPEADPARFAAHLATRGCLNVSRDMEWWGGTQPRHDRPAIMWRPPKEEAIEIRKKDDPLGSRMVILPVKGLDPVEIEQLDPGKMPERLRALPLDE